MNIVVAVTLILLAIILHEIGHAWAMHSKGVEFEEIGIGLKVWWLPSLKITCNGIVLRFNLIPIIGYVENSETGARQLEKLPYSDFSYVMGAGILVNLIYGFVLGLIVSLASGGKFWFIPLLAIVILWLFRKPFCKYLVPALGLLVFTFIIYQITKAPTETMVGPIGLGILVRDMSSSLTNVLIFVSAVSLSVALVNMLPFFGLDGGRIVGRVIEKISPTGALVYKLVGLILLSSMLILAFASDALKLFKK